MSSIDNLIAEFNKFHDEFKFKIQDEFKKVFKEYWDVNPKIKAVTWMQFTPYFNDGEACEFSVHDMWPLSEKAYEEWQEEGAGAWDAEEYSFDLDYNAMPPEGQPKYGWEDRPYKEVDGLTQEEIKNAMSIKKLNCEAMENIFLAMFDDHVRVIATRDGFEVEEFSHD